MVDKYSHESKGVNNEEPEVHRAHRDHLSPVPFLIIRKKRKKCIKRVYLLFFFITNVQFWF